LVAGTLIFAVVIIPNEIIESAIIAFILLLFIISFIVATTILSLSLCFSSLLNRKYGVAACIFLGSIGIVTGTYEGAEITALISSQAKMIVFSISGILSAIAVALSLYIGKKASSEDLRYSLLYNLAVRISSIRGTKFYSANCDDANFSGASLHSTDFRKTSLRRTNFHKVAGISQIIIQDGYLRNSKVRKLLVSKDGHGQQFENLDLRDVNLEGADLSSSSFQSTNLSEANLVNADFSKANLTQAQLYRADLTGACFTGAYIQDWGISVHTRLQDVQCSHVYMRTPTHEDPDPCRKPDRNGQFFEKDDFADFIAPIIKTLDLYQKQDLDPRKIEVSHKSLDLIHHDGIDPNAAALALKRLVEQNPDAGIEVVAVEGRGNERVRLQARVNSDTNRSQLSTQYFKEYNNFHSLSQDNLQEMFVSIAEKDNQILRLEKMLETAIQQPRFYVETIQNQGEFIMSQSKGNVSVSGVQGNVSGIAAAGEGQTMTGVVLGVVSGSVTNSINQLSSSPDLDTPGLKELLTQLQASIEAEAELSEEDKVEALEQVKTLADAGQNPEDSGLQKAAKTAMKILKGTAASLPDATELVEACTKLLPAISTLLVLI
jgi:uncharacterized protein YjbI with pentapeptide repeats